MPSVPRSRLLTITQWEHLEDPRGGRYEILDGELVVNPSASSVHNRLAEDLADVLRAALREAGVDAEVTLDVEWRLTLGDRVREAPRPDVAVGWVDPRTRRLGGPLPLLVVEVWDDHSAAFVVRAKRRYWAEKGARWLWEVTVGDDPADTVVEIFDLLDDVHAPVLVLAGDDAHLVTEPFPVRLVPAELLGWTDRLARSFTDARAEAARAAELARSQGAALDETRTRLDESRTELDESRSELDTAHRELDAAHAELDAARRRAEVLAARLRAAGIDPDDLPDEV